MNRPVRLPVMLFCVLLGVGLWLYTAIRAYRLDMTHDECYTYTQFSGHSFMDIISNQTTIKSANNHILNTLFVKLEDALFGPREFFLRLHSVLSYGFYLLFAFLLLRRFRSEVVLVVGFVVLTVNPYLLDFFSLARGYAMAIMFMMGSLYFLIRYTEEERRRYWYYSLIMAGFSVCSNFSMLNYVVALVVVFQWFLFSKGYSFKQILKRNIPTLVALLALLAFCYEPMRTLIAFNQFNFGGEKGVWEDTVKTSIQHYFYNKPYFDPINGWLQVAVAIVAIASALLLLYRLFGPCRLRFDLRSIFFACLVLIVASNYAQHLLLKSPFLSDRFALFLVPLFFLGLISLLDAAVEGGVWLRIPAMATGISLCLFVFWHLRETYNLSYCHAWGYDSTTREMLRDLNEARLRNHQDTVRLGCTWVHEPAINFYRKAHALDWLKPVTRDGVEGQYDYYYVLYWDAPKMDGRHKRELRAYAIPATVLME